MCYWCSLEWLLFAVDVVFASFDVKCVRSAASSLGSL